MYPPISLSLVSIKKEIDPFFCGAFPFPFRWGKDDQGCADKRIDYFLLNVFCPSFPMARSPFYHFLPKRVQSDREHRSYRRDLQFLLVIRISVSIPVVNHPQTQAPIACGIILSI